MQIMLLALLSLCDPWLVEGASGVYCDLGVRPLVVR